MSLPEILLAVALLNGTTPPELNDLKTFEAQFPMLRQTLLALAVDIEILDPREVRSTFSRAESIRGDLEALQKRYQDLRDAPAAVDAFRFPERPMVNEFLVFNRAYLKHVEMRRPLEAAPAADLSTIQQEIEDLYRVWDTVRDARCEYYYVWVRRYALKRLRDLLGEDAYYRGELPPYVPIWRFQELVQK